MQIDKELLSEVNYTGSRLIEVTDETVIALQSELSELQKEANPYLAEMEKYTPEMDRVYGEINKLEEQKKALREEIAPTRALYDEQLVEVEKIDQKAQVIKNKIQPLILDLVKEELGEFEKALQVIVRDGKTYVEVVDEIEEAVKKIRASKEKK